MKHANEKLIAALLLTVVLSSATHGARTAVKSGRGGGGQDNHDTKTVNGPVVIKMHRQNVPHPEHIRRNRIVRENTHVRWPEQDETGAKIIKQPATAPPREHVSIVRNKSVIQDIRHQRRVEVVPNRFYWHTVDGMRYAHYYDHHRHWYGFYHGPRFYWTYLYADHWWWYDPGFSRWVYWWDGYWWWPSPAGAVYVYVDNNYYPYNAAGVIVKNPETEAPPDSLPLSNAGTTWKSPGGQRMVQIFGGEDEAFLYDTTSGSPSFMKYLGRGVQKVRFSGGNEERPLQILLDYKDGNFALFTADGNPVDTETLPAAEQPSPPTIPPSEIPPPPSENP